MNQRGSKRESEGIPFKFYIYIGTGVIFGSLFLFLWMFGLDLGIIRTSGRITPIASLLVVGVALLFEWLIDIRYNTAIREFNDESVTAVDYIPIANSLFQLDKIFKIAGFSALGISGFALLLAFTPLINIVPLGSVHRVGPFSTTLFVVGVVAFLIVRGVAHFKNKMDLSKLHAELNGDDMSVVSKVSVLTKLFYFLPIARMSVMIMDAQFARTVKLMCQAADQLQEGRY
jgi:hypothetical protein